MADAAGKLRARLTELGLNQTALGERLGVASGVVSRWCSGDRSPSLQMAIRLQREIGIPVEDWDDAADTKPAA